MSTSGAVFGYIYAAETHDVLTVEAQQVEIETYALARGFDLDECLLERNAPLTVPVADRLKGRMLLGILGAGDVLIVARRELAFCDAGDAIATCRELQRRQAALHIVDLNADVTARFALATPDKLEALELELRAERAHRYRHGPAHGGHVPFGFTTEWAAENGRAVRMLVEDPTQQAAIGLIHELAEQRVSLRAIADRVREATGAVLSHEGVRKLLGRADEQPAAPAAPRQGARRHDQLKDAPADVQERVRELVEDMRDQTDREIISEVELQFGVRLCQAVIHGILDAAAPPEPDTEPQPALAADDVPEDPWPGMPAPAAHDGRCPAAA